MSKNKIYGIAVTLFLALWNMQSAESGWQVNATINVPVTIIHYK